MIPSEAVLKEITRAETEQEIRDFFQIEYVQAQLIKQDVSRDEVSKRLSSLSRDEMNKMPTRSYAKKLNSIKFKSSKIGQSMPVHSTFMWKVLIIQMSDS